MTDTKRVTNKRPTTDTDASASKRRPPQATATITIPRILMEYITSPRILINAILGRDDHIAAKIARDPALCPDPNQVDPDRLRRPLITACIRGLHDTVQALLNRGADPLLTDFSGRDAIVACFDVPVWTSRKASIPARASVFMLEMLADVVTVYGDRKLRLLGHEHEAEWEEDEAATVARTDRHWPCGMHHVVDPEDGVDFSCTALYRACRYDLVGVVSILMHRFGLTLEGTSRCNGEKNALTRAFGTSYVFDHLLTIGAPLPTPDSSRWKFIVDALNKRAPNSSIPTTIQDLHTHNYRLLGQLHFASGQTVAESPVSLLCGFPDILKFICGHSRGTVPPDRDKVLELP
jgi:hypothetical protein